jgi:integrase
MIDQADLADSTRHKYKSALTRYVDAGYTLTDPASLRIYAGTLTASEKSKFKAALGVWIRQTKTHYKGMATPANVHEVQAILWRLDAIKQAVKVKAIKGETAHIWLTLTQQEKLLNAIPQNAGNIGARDNVLLRVMLGAGLRRSEATAVKFSDIKPMGDMPVFEIQGKGKKRRIVPIGQQLHAVLLQWHAIAGDGFILRSIDQRGAVTDSISDVSVFRIVRKYGQAIGKPELAPHDLRRTFAENIRRAKVDIATISTLLGHESVQTTMRYLNVAVDLSVVPADLLPC